MASTDGAKLSPMAAKTARFAALDKEGLVLKLSGELVLMALASVVVASSGKSKESDDIPFRCPGDDSSARNSVTENGEESFDSSSLVASLSSSFIMSNDKHNKEHQITAGKEENARKG